MIMMIAQKLHDVGHVAPSGFGYRASTRLTVVKPTANSVCKMKTYPKGANMGQHELEPTQEELLQRVALHRDKAAFRVLFLHYVPRLKSHLMKFGPAGPQAEDLAQDVMVKLWQNANKFDPEKARVSTWIFRIARNTYIDHTRKQKYPELNADDHMADMVAPERTDKEMEMKQTAASIEKAMAALKPEQKAVIRLSYFEEMSHSAIAAHLALPLGTVKSRIRMSFNVLRRELGDKA